MNETKSELRLTRGNHREPDDFSADRRDGRPHRPGHGSAEEREDNAPREGPGAEHPHE